MSDADERLRRALAGLRAEYLAEAPRRLAELWSAFARVQNGEADALADLRTRLHKLAGTGGAYGLVQVTDRARAGEQAVHAMMAGGGVPAADQVQVLRTHIQHVADAFAAAPDTE